MLVDEHWDALEDIFIESFGPNHRHHNECAQLTSKTGKEAYVTELPDSIDGTPVCCTISWQDGESKYYPKAVVFAQLLEWKGVGPLTAKNIFQLVKDNVSVAGTGADSESKWVQDLGTEFKEMLENDFVFILCETWKILAFLATGNERYLRFRDNDDGEDGV